MSHKHCLVDLSFSEPAGLFTSEEHFDRHLLPSPAGQPHLTTSPFPNHTGHLDLFRYGALHLSKETQSARRENRNKV